MSNALKIRLSRTPDPQAVLAARKVRLSRRMIKRVFGTANAPSHGGTSSRRRGRSRGSPVHSRR